MSSRLSALLMVLAAIGAGSGAACGKNEPPATGGDASSSDVGGGGQDGSSGQDAGTSADVGGSSSDTGGGGAYDSGVSDMCNPLTQTGCTMPPATKCIVESTTATAGASCSQSGPNDVDLGQMCTGGDCKPMLACVRTTTAASTCVHLCDIQSGGAGCESLGNDYDCRARIRGTNWGFCVPLGATCDPLSQSPCTPAQACAPLLRTTGQYEFRCKQQGMQGDGQACGSGGGGDCARGFVCVRAGLGGNPICRHFCAMNQDCTSPQQCTGTVAMPPFHFCQGM